MSKAVKAAGLGLVIFVTVWVVTLWQWYRSQRPVSSEEVATQLVLLPAALTAVALLVWWLSARMRRWSAQPIEPQAPDATPDRGAAHAQPARSGDASSARELATLGSVCILAEALALPHGDDAEQAWVSLTAEQVRPGLDPELQDPDGLPVFTSRVPGLSTQDWLDAHAEIDGATLPQSLLRAMALIEAPLHRLVSSLPEWVVEGDGDAERAAKAGATAACSASGPTFLSGVGQAGAEERALRHRATAPVLEVQVWVPSTWAPADRELFLNWLMQQSGQLLDWARSAGCAEPPRWTLAVLDTPEEGWDRLFGALQSWQAELRPRLLMVMAADSLVDESGVLALQSRGELFTALHQGGRIPGEAAAGLLLANRAMAARCVGPHPWLGTPATVRRHRSSDRAGRPGADELIAAGQQVLAPWSRMPSQVSGSAGWWWLSDADHRSSRTSELFEAFQALQPDGDVTQAVQRLGDAWGDLGAARALAPAAMAASVVRMGVAPSEDAGATPALIGLVQASHRRWVIPIWPADLARLPIDATPAEPLPAPSSSVASDSGAQPLAA